jgi:hypothetical protein
MVPVTMRVFLCLFLAFTSHTLLASDIYRVGDTVASFSLKDQHDREQILAPGVRVLLAGFSMSAAKSANHVLSQKPASFLDEHHAVFLADIRGMPAIGRAFALPKMRKYPHRILLVDTDGILECLPREENKLTALHLDAELRITDIRFLDPEKELSAFFDVAP